MRKLITISCYLIFMSISATAFADVGTISFYGNNVTKPGGFIQGCGNVSTVDLAAVDYRVVIVSDSLQDKCGKKYIMHCISTPGKRSCTGNMIEVLVVGHCPNGQCSVAGKNVTMMIAFIRYGLLVQSRSTAWANIEYAQE
ncbi:hypothetical protein [Dickeya sp. NCPPB 3274]|uniref:hypothetical protein n=1 Tax=Dickeya sp. NCPPB 3274 TaxID=568766 RepID=UPI0008FC00E5|nr:hypothetical protein [Dickeya sp. NCPPB 3274]